MTVKYKERFVSVNFSFVSKHNHSFPSSLVLSNLASVPSAYNLFSLETPLTQTANETES